MTDLIHRGGAVKALPNGHIEGYLVVFGDANTPDLSTEKDFFTAQTDFCIEDGMKSAVYYAHALDPTIKNRRLTNVSMKVDDVGVWVEGQIKARDEYEKALLKMAEDGKLGWSSGTASHLVTRKAIETDTGTVHEILSWPLGLDASLTPTPAEPRAAATYTLKSLAAMISVEGAAKATWSTAFQNDLPDSSFASIEDGGKKDSDGKTTPRSLRHFPYKDSDGKPDAAHVRNALARIPQSGLSADAKASATRKVQAAARTLGIGADNKKQLPAGWSYADLMQFLESELNEDFGAPGSYGPFGDYQPSVYYSIRNLVEEPVDSVIYVRSDEPGDTFRRPYSVNSGNDAEWGDEETVVQTTVYVNAVDGDDANNGPPMMAGKQADITALKAMLTRSMTFGDHADVATSAMEGFVTRAAKAVAMDIKAGRVLSGANRDKLKRIHAGMMTAHTAMESHLQAINDMLLSTDPDAKKGVDELEALRTEFIRLQSAQLHMAS